MAQGAVVMARPWCGNMAMVMLASEADCGRRPLWPDLKRLPKWFDPFDWAVWPVISWDKREVHIVAIASARKGAFRRMVDRIVSHGLTPVVVGPMGPTMPAILAKWGWQETIVGEGWDCRDEWRPAKGIEVAKPARPEGARPERREPGPKGSPNLSNPLFSKDTP